MKLIEKATIEEMTGLSKRDVGNSSKS